jgi:hypothetical protein
VVVADGSKRSPRGLGTTWRRGVPVEVLPPAYVPVMRALARLGGAPALRMGGPAKAGPVVTDNGGFVVDADFGPIADPAALHAMLGEPELDARQAAAQADEAAQRLMGTLNTPFDITDMRFHSSASIGVAMFGGAGISGEDVLMHADSAMYRAKAAGRGTVRFYDPAMRVALQTRAALETDLRRALSEGQLRLAYQAQVEANGRIVGAEVLLRWQHPVRGPIPPMDFIPMAEETGLIVPIGQWVLETACMQLAGWARSPQTRALRLSVNVSARQVRQPDFVQRVERALLGLDGREQVGLGRGRHPTRRPPPAAAAALGEARRGRSRATRGVWSFGRRRPPFPFRRTRPARPCRRRRPRGR